MELRGGAYLAKISPWTGVAVPKPSRGLPFTPHRPFFQRPGGGAGLGKAVGWTPEVSIGGGPGVQNVIGIFCQSLKCMVFSARKILVFRAGGRTQLFSQLDPGGSGG